MFHESLLEIVSESLSSSLFQEDDIVPPPPHDPILSSTFGEDNEYACLKLWIDRSDDEDLPVGIQFRDDEAYLIWKHHAEQWLGTFNSIFVRAAVSQGRAGVVWRDSAGLLIYEGMLAII